MFKKILFVISMATMLTVFACAQKKPSEIRTYRELLNYSAAAMKTYKGAPSEYASFLKDLITAMGNEADEAIEEGSAITKLSDKDEIEGMVFVVMFVAGAVGEKLNKYDNIDEKQFFNTLEQAFIKYAK